MTNLVPKLIFLISFMSPHVQALTLDSRIRNSHPADRAFLIEKIDSTRAFEDLLPMWKRQYRIVSHESAEYKKVKRILDELEQNIRAKLPGVLDSIPRLRLEIQDIPYISDEPMYKRTRLAVPLIWNTSLSTDHLTDVDLMFNSNGGISVFGPGTGDAKNLDYWQLKALVDLINRKAVDPLRSKCKYSLEFARNKSPYIQVNSDCNVDPRLVDRNYWGAPGLMPYSGVRYLYLNFITNVIKISTHSIKLLSKNALAALLAHEMSHIFLGHLPFNVNPFSGSYYYSLLEPRVYNRPPKRAMPLDNVGLAVSGIDSPLSAEIGEIVNWIQSRNLDLAESAALEEANLMRLGYYTFEQEADEVSLEILEASSIPLTASAEWFLAFSAEGGDPGCKKWEQLQNGREIPSLLEYKTPHHTGCFRKYNIEQLIKAKYQTQ